MGKPKFSTKKYETPSHPWQEDRIKQENELVRKYGLKNKREIWKAQTKLKKFRSQARELLAKAGTGDSQSKKEADQLLMHLNRINVLPINSTLDDVLALGTESILSRRLQTLTYLKGLANTPNQARQLISHGHIAIANRKVTVPGYIVTKEEENNISYTTDSNLNDAMHPARPKADFKSFPAKNQPKPIENKPVKHTPKTEQISEPQIPVEDQTKQKENKTEEPTIKTTNTEETKQEIKSEKKPAEQPKQEKNSKEKIKEGEN